MGCCIHQVVTRQICPPLSWPFQSGELQTQKSPGQTQGDSVNRLLSRSLLQPELTLLSHLGQKRRAGWEGPLMAPSSTGSQQEQRQCHCRDEATNATRIIHDNYDQVRVGRGRCGRRRRAVGP